MGFVTNTNAGTYRANWRDPAGKQKAKTFRTKKEARAWLAQVENEITRGGYIDPRAGRVLFGEHAARWLSSRNVEATTGERTKYAMSTQILPRWSDLPLSRIDHMAIQEWVSELSEDLAPATVAKCYGLVSQILKSAVRARLIPFDPSEGVKVPSTYRPRSAPRTISREDFTGRLLPAVPAEHRAIVCTGALAGLRWGECAGLPWSAVDLDNARIRVGQVAVEHGGRVHLKPFPKSVAGSRTVPVPPRLAAELGARQAISTGPLVFANRVGQPLRRSNFRRQIWLPSLVRAGLLGSITEADSGGFVAVWPDRDGKERTVRLGTQREAVAHVVARAIGGLRFHDLRHSYATWLVTDGVPINVVQQVMGHEQASTTLNRYTHGASDYDSRVQAVFRDPADFSLTSEGDDDDDDPPPGVLARL